MKLLQPLEIGILVAITLLLYYDFFSNRTLILVIPESMVWMLIIGLYLFSLLMKRYREADHKEIVRWQITSTVYFVLVIGIFTALGGQSASSISFGHTYMWLVLVLAVLDIGFEWRKGRHSNA